MRHVNALAVYDPDKTEVIAAVKTRERATALDAIALSK
jgi:hypothetical protein